MKALALALLALLSGYSGTWAAPTPTPTPVEMDEHLQYWLRTLQTHPMELVRKNAARTLGSMGDRRAVSALIGALRDPFFGVRNEAARGLGLLGDEQAMTPLYESMQKDKDQQVRRSTKDAIERIRAYQEYQKKKQEKLEKAAPKR